MLDGNAIADELFEMAAEPADAILHRAVQRIHQVGAPYDWVGVYLLDRDQLILHSYIGKPTHPARIRVGNGLSGLAVAEDRDINAPDVGSFERYVAYSADTRSEIAVLIRHGGRAIGLIDIGSDTEAAFGPDDERELRAIADTIGDLVGPRLRFGAEGSA